jgi:hypothetical protein
MIGAQGRELAGVRAGGGAIINAPLSRRGILAAIVAAPVLAGLGAVSNSGIGELTRPAGVADKIARGGARLFNAPWLAPGAQLRLPEGIQAVPVEGFFENRPRVAETSFAWPHMPVAGGEMVNASLVPEHSAPSRMAILSGFSEGRYELIHSNGRIERVDWDARRFPYLWYWGEFGASKGLPFMGRFYTLGLEPFSHPPVS